MFGKGLIKNDIDQGKRGTKKGLFGKPETKWPFLYHKILKRLKLFFLISCGWFYLRNAYYMIIHFAFAQSLWRLLLSIVKELFTKSEIWAFNWNGSDYLMNDLTKCWGIQPNSSFNSCTYLKICHCKYQNIFSTDEVKCNLISRFEKKLK